MRVKLQLVMCSDEGHEETVTEVITLNKNSQRIEHLGLTMAEAKQLLSALQRHLLQHQVEASIMGSATLCSSRWTQRRRRQLHCVQNRRKHRVRLLAEKALRRRGSIRPGEEKVVNGGEALTLAR